jgi:hypothetical protein
MDMSATLKSMPILVNLRGISNSSSAKLLALLAEITLVWKGLPGTNTLAYFASSSATKKNVL